MHHFSERETVFIPDGIAPVGAFGRSTALCFSAHQDDIEFMAYNAIAECFGAPDKWFSACVVTDGAGSPRAGIYENYGNEEMKAIRVREQNKAAAVGEYAAMVQLGYTSGEVKDAANSAVTKSIAAVLQSCRPDTVYTHNLADKHDTHVAVALRVIDAVRSLPPGARPERLLGMEVWRGLDWLPDDRKTVFDASAHPGLAAALMGVYDSQIAGGKRYDRAVLGRRAANATFFESHGTDEMTEAVYAIDMSPIICSGATPAEFISGHIDGFRDEVLARLSRLAGGER